MSCTPWRTDVHRLKSGGDFPGKMLVQKSILKMMMHQPWKKGRKRNRKRKGKAILAVEGSGNPGKKPKAESSDKEVAVCTCGHEAAADEKTDGPYCKIHRTKGHDLLECWQVEQLAEKQKQEYEKRNKDKAKDGTGGFGKKKHGGRGGRSGKGKQQKEKPARGCEKKEDDEDDDEDGDGSEQEFQNAVNAMCVDGGASLHSLHRQLKQWIRDVNAEEPTMDAQKPLKWSHTPIIFDLMPRTTLIAQPRSGVCRCWFHQQSATSR
jgi:hypothetical protein